MVTTASRVVFLLVALLAMSLAPRAVADPPVAMTADNRDTLADVLAAATAPTGPTPRSDVISGRFLGTPYAADTLVGSADESEELVVELNHVDCFTLADYVEAAKRSRTPDQFVASLTDIRYRDGIVSFANRKHFFTDWSASSPPVASDVTTSLSDRAVGTAKTLNARDSGGVYLRGIPVVERTVTHIPSTAVDGGVVDQLRTGDYLGAYAEDGGLDVTHVGIFIDSPSGPMFRNASSLDAHNAVVDSPLWDYLRTVPGIVVLRPLV